VIAGLVERQHPGKRKSGKQVTFSTDLIYDVLRKYEPDHLLIEAGLGRRARAHDRRRPARRPARHRRPSGWSTSSSIGSARSAVPVMVMIGRESLPQGAVDEELLLEAETLAGAAMRTDEADSRRAY
jgi:ATP-dependent Lhr-like helicase